MIKYKRYERYKDSGVEWIGEIPEEWEFRRISHICTLGRGRVISKIEIAENEGEYPVYSSQTENDGVLGYINTYDFEGDYVTWTTDGANAGTVFRRTGRFNCTNVCGTLKPKENNLDLSYLTYALSLETKRYVRLDINPKLMNNEMAKIRVLFPPSDEQKAIANFLDQKTAEIDSLIADKEKLIELLQEKRQAIITEAVTKGLNPNVRMKDSGIEWIGEIPEHWEVVKIKLLLKVKDGTHDTPDFVDKGEGTVPLITSKNIIDGEIDFLNAKHISREDYININRRSDVGKNDIIMPMIGTIGNPVIVKTDKEFSIKNVALFKTSYNELLAKFIYYTLQSNLIKIQFDLLNRGGVQAFVSLDVLRNLLVIKMPSTELKEIVLYLENKTQEIDSLILSIRVGINKLKEYRQSLISEAVTGKIDVRDYVVSN